MYGVIFFVFLTMCAFFSKCLISFFPTVLQMCSNRLNLLRRRRVYRLYVPNRVRILLNAAVAAEKPHPAHADYALGDPLIMILIRLIHQRVRLDVAVEVVTDEVVIPLVDDGVAQRSEAAGVTELAASDGIEDLGQIGVESERAVIMGVTQVFNIFRQVSEKKDVRVPDFPSDFNLHHVKSTYAKNDR